jgi:hypothetical protein
MASTNHHYLLGIVHDLLDQGVDSVSIVSKGFALEGTSEENGEEVLTLMWNRKADDK